MKIFLAKTAGFCMGVSLALKKLDDELERNADAGRIVTFGYIIHNPQVVEDYRRRGVVQAASLDELEKGDRVLIRAHGIPKSDEQKLTNLEVTIIDATCPKVKRAQLGIASMDKEGQDLLLFGEADHPEVQGLLSYANAKARVFGSLEEFDSLELDPGAVYFLASQTTQEIEQYRKIALRAEERLGYKPIILNTVCTATRKRMQETTRLAREVDLVVVVGGYASGNTRRLAEAVKSEGKKALHIETPQDLDLNDLSGIKTIGLTAGASTPKYLIEATQKFLIDI